MTKVALTKNRQLTEGDFAETRPRRIRCAGRSHRFLRGHQSIIRGRIGVFQERIRISALRVGLLGLGGTMMLDEWRQWLRIAMTDQSMTRLC